MSRMLKTQAVFPWPPPLPAGGAPDFAVRGFMLDISRGKVPTWWEFAALIELLARLRYNHLQLYVEHTFQFTGHRRVWRGTGALSAGDLRELQRLCAARGIELAPCLNSFGHLARWLKHKEYQPLAECPEGYVHPLSGWMPTGATLRPNAASLRFLDGLWAEYLPLFQSPRFNLGGDEPWELGQGWSKARVARLGKHRVYLDFLQKLHRLAVRHGKRMLFWGDILLEKPELATEVPADATALLWGYEAHHPFAEQCAKLAAARRDFWICPGTSAWNSFTGRTDRMLANLESAARHGRAHGASGWLLCAWGDGGNHQPWPAMYPALVFAAGLAWNGAAVRRADLPRALDAVFAGGRRGFGEALLELGRVENPIASAKHNCSRHHPIFFAPRDRLASALEHLTPAALRQSAAALARVRKKIAGLRGLAPGERPARAELLLGADMAAWALRRAQLALAGKDTRILAASLRALVRRYREVWRRRARPGGLRESAARMRAVEKEL